MCVFSIARAAVVFAGLAASSPVLDCSYLLFLSNDESVTSLQAVFMTARSRLAIGLSTLTEQEVSLRGAQIYC